MFNALDYTKNLEEVGFNREQSEQTVKVILNIMNKNFATKEDLKLEIMILRHEIKAEIKELRHEIRELESRMTIKMGSFLVLGIGLLKTIDKFF